LGLPLVEVDEDRLQGLGQFSLLKVLIPERDDVPYDALWFSCVHALQHPTYFLHSCTTHQLPRIELAQPHSDQDEIQLDEGVIGKGEIPQFHQSMEREVATEPFIDVLI
jgi:hypothetical protein